MVNDNRANGFAQFWSKVDKVGHGGCWIWRGGLTLKGCGRVSIKDRERKAHRVAFEALRGEIPEGVTLDHLWHAKVLRKS